MSSNTNHVVLICGGSSSGKSSAAKHLKKFIAPPKLLHLDFDDQILKLCNHKFNGNIPESFSHLISCLPEAAEKGSFFMDHWMPPKYEQRARNNLSEFATFYVWLYCSSSEELMRREEVRTKAGEDRGEGITEAGASLPNRLEYHCKINTYNCVFRRS
jgi:hypothetical protein